MKHTENLRLRKPEGTDYYDVEDFNENADEIDARVKELMDAREAIEKELSLLKKSASDGKSAIASAITDMGGGESANDAYSGAVIGQEMADGFHLAASAGYGLTGTQNSPRL